MVQKTSEIIITINRSDRFQFEIVHMCTYYTLQRHSFSHKFLSAILNTTLYRFYTQRMQKSDWYAKWNRSAPIFIVSQKWSQFGIINTNNYVTDIDSNKAFKCCLSFTFVIAPSFLLPGNSSPFLKSIRVGSP